MTVKNTTKSPMQFGDITIESKKTGTLQKPFDEKHPVIQDFIIKGWLKKTADKSENKNSTKDKPKQEQQTNSEAGS